MKFLCPDLLIKPCEALVQRHETCLPVIRMPIIASSTVPLALSMRAHCTISCVCVLMKNMDCGKCFKDSRTPEIIDQIPQEIFFNKVIKGSEQITWEFKRTLLFVNFLSILIYR